MITFRRKTSQLIIQPINNIIYLIFPHYHRTWRTDLPKGTCVLVSTSIDHPEGSPVGGSIRGTTLASRFLIEPAGSGRSRLTHISRVDTKGRTPDWYNKSYGHLMAVTVAKIRDMYKQEAQGPETKV